MKYSYKYPRPAVTVDCVVFGYDEKELKVLLIQRGLPPFEGGWALPGGFVQMEETLDEAAFRELREETGLSDLFLEQLYTFGAVARDPRERVISIAYYALVKLMEHRVKAATDARNAEWHRVANLPELAFDHAQILDAALKRLKAKVRYEPIGFELLPDKFTLSQIQNLYETVLERPLDKRNFRKKILSMGLLTDLEELLKGARNRAPKLFRFDEKKYEELKRQQFSFEL